MQEPFQDFIFIGHFYLFSVWPFGSSSTAENECTHPTRARHTGLRTAKRLRVSYHPLLRLLVPSIPFLENTGVHREKKEINREKERERALLIDDALILRKRCGFIEAWRISEFRSIPWAKRGERTKKSGATGIEKKNAKKTKGKERMKKEEGRQGKSGPWLKTSSIDSPPAQYPWKAQRASVIAMEVMNKVNNHVQSPLKYFLSNVEAARVMGWRLNFNGASRRRCRSIGYRRVANVLQNCSGERWWHWKFRCRKTSAVRNG